MKVIPLNRHWRVVVVAMALTSVGCERPTARLARTEHSVRTLSGEAYFAIPAGSRVKSAFFIEQGMVAPRELVCGCAISCGVAGVWPHKAPVEVSIDDYGPKSRPILLEIKNLETQTSIKFGTCQRQ